MGHEQTAHPGTTPSDFLRHALSPSLKSPGLCAFPSVETLWRNGACSPACGDAGYMGMRSPSNTKKPHWPSIPFATNRITSISRACQKPSASRPPIAHRKADSGNWMRRYGTWPNGSLIMLPEDDGENRACIFSLHYLKSRKARKRNAEASSRIF